MISQEKNLYNYDDKKKIVFRIQNLKKKKFYIKLFQIILDENIDYNTNNNGVFFNVNKLSGKQFNVINHFLDTIDTSTVITDSESFQESESLSEI